MGRSALVEFVLTSLTQEEISAYTHAGRRFPRDGSSDFATLHTIVRRRLEDRFDTSILNQYFASTARTENEALRAQLRLFNAHTEQNGATAVSVATGSRASPARPTVHTETGACPNSTPAESSIPTLHPTVPPVADSGSSSKRSKAAPPKAKSVPTSVYPPVHVPDPDWPRPITPELIQSRISEFRSQTALELHETCAVCARRSFSHDLLFLKKTVTCRRTDVRLLDLSPLAIKDPHIRANHMSHFNFGHPLLDGLALDRSGVHVNGWRAEIDICHECRTSLKGGSLPALSLANDNIRGELPPSLQGCTWLEERLCALYLPSACVVRLYDMTAPGAPDHRPRVMRGHTCSFPLNTMSTAVKLPRAFGDGTALVSCLIIGPHKPRIQDLRKVFKVRRKVVEALFLYLRDNFKGYPQFPINEDALAELPEDDVPELLMRSVVFEENGSVPSLFEAETAGLENHPGLSEQEALDDTDGRTFLEHHGLLDVNGVTIPAHERTAVALGHAAGMHDSGSLGGSRPDLVIRHGTSFVQEYHNPNLFPGMYPTLFPWGIGGLMVKRSVPLSFDRQAAHLLDLADPSFRRHWSYIFMVANMKQRREINLRTSLACSARDFDRISQTIRGIDMDIIKTVEEHLRAGGQEHTLSGREATVFRLLKQCQLVSAKVPGSKAAMNRARSDIRGYIGEFGIFHIFLTLNPSATHSPVFQVLYGDTGVNLDVKVPTMPPFNERAKRVADDPVAASDYFHFHVAAIFKYLFGWNQKTRSSIPEGGILGAVNAIFMVKEHTMRGQLHGHALIWLKGGLNPGPLRERLKTDIAFQERYLAYVDDLIVHHLPSDESRSPTARCPRQERPPDPADPFFADVAAEDHRLLGEEVQRHKCTTTCLKGGRSSCRFLFPHDVVRAPLYDAQTNSVILRVLDPWVNWHNKWLLIAARHNVDVKWVHSGLSGIAAISYITAYATKSEETPANQVSMIKTVLERMAALGKDSTIIKDLLCRCVMQFGRERQIHAQQAATYVRELDDTWGTHPTVPMFSGRMMLTVQKLYGPIRTIDKSLSPPEEPFAHSDAAPTSTISVNAVQSDAARPSGTATADGDFAHTLSNTLSDANPEDTEAEDEADELLPLCASGKAHQVDDYLHRGPTLDHLNFYEFVRYCELTKLPSRPSTSFHPLRDTHPNHETMCHTYTPTKPRGVPRALLPRVPRSNGTPTHGDPFCAAMLAHFRPFGITVPLKPRSASYEAHFRDTEFSSEACRIMDNWKALTECDDARDAEELKRRKRQACRDQQNDQAAESIIQGDQPSIDDSNADINMESLINRRSTHSTATLTLMATLATSQWFARCKETPTHIPALDSDRAVPCPPFTLSQRKKWQGELSELDARSKANASVPRATSGILASAFSFDKSETAAPETTEEHTIQQRRIRAHQTLRYHWRDPPPHVIINTLVLERKLTKSQALAFKIAARHFFTELTMAESPAPLRLFMHGEAGTGKTVVVRLLRELLERYGRGHQILFMAPTGKAACAIGGATQHSTFALRVNRKGRPTEELGSLPTDVNSANRVRYLQTTFANVRWLFFDEVSMTSCEIMAEIDQALRIGRQKFDAPFGGMNVLFAGDLCQLPPVGAAALYSACSLPSRTAEARTMMELGRAAWQDINEVVNFVEQMRMQSNDMAGALRRLRLRRCTQQDADLFNSNVLKSAQNPSGIVMDGDKEAIVLTRTNETVRALNHQKATETALSHRKDLVLCCAQDKTSAVMTAERRVALLNYNGSGSTKVGLGKIPLYRGMPVVYRGANQSVALGITNGAFATVESWDVATDKWGHQVAQGVVLRFVNGDDTVKFSNLDASVVPILPSTTNFKFSAPGTDDTSGATVQNISRRQLPIQPGFAMTVHSAQGITSHGPVVVDLRRGGFEAYVAASRATRREDLLLVAPVKLSELNSPRLPLGLRNELRRLDKLADATLRRHDNDDWTVEGAQVSDSATTSSPSTSSSTSSLANSSLADTASSSAQSSSKTSYSDAPTPTFSSTAAENGPNPPPPPSVSPPVPLPATAAVEGPPRKRQRLQ